MPIRLRLYRASKLPAVEVKRTDQRAVIRAQIETAFRDTPCPGDGFHDISASENDEGVVAYFRGTSWRGHTVTNLRRHASALCFFTPRAFRYWLPAFMLATLEDPSTADVIPSYIVGGIKESPRLNEFTTDELAAIEAFLGELELPEHNGPPDVYVQRAIKKVRKRLAELGHV